MSLHEASSAVFSARKRLIQKKCILISCMFRRITQGLQIKTNLVLLTNHGYAESMFISENFIVFPEGDVQEIPGRLSINEMVDVNGYPVEVPLPTHKMIVFRVARIKTNEYRGSSETLHYLEQMTAEELLPYAGK